jgi:hypothetical protein
MLTTGKLLFAETHRHEAVVRRNANNVLRFITLCYKACSGSRSRQL